MKKLHFFVILTFHINSFAQIVYVNANDTVLIFDNYLYHEIDLDLNLDNTYYQSFSISNSMGNP